MPPPPMGLDRSRAMQEKRANRYVVLVIVTYHPQWEEIYTRVNHLMLQMDEVVIVDNGSPGADAEPLGTHMQANCHRVLLKENEGIAKAQNIGIQWAVGRGATHVILLDQDSNPASDMVALLMSAAERLGNSVEKLGVIAPRFVDLRQRELAPFFRIDGLRVVPTTCSGRVDFLPIDAAIASGSLFPVATLSAVGAFREKLFIDFVDIEWCIRARSLGYQSYAVCDAVLHHSLGESPRSLLGRQVAHHSPLRSYYFVRNAVWLMRQGYVPVAWKLAVGRQLALRYLFYGFTVAPRLAYVRMMTLGVLHGLRGRLGRLD
jgi:rhamnosyltransferase